MDRGQNCAIKVIGASLETRDQYFPYSEKPFPPQGLWRIYGVYLPDEVLTKIYQANVCKVVPGVREKLQKWIEIAQHRRPN